MMDLVLRFLVGGVIVSFFAILGDIFHPKSFAGLFAGAPSVALATLGIAFATHGPGYVAVEGRSMLLGAGGLFVYCRLCLWLLMSRNWPAMAATLVSIPAWLMVSLGLWWLLFCGASP